MNRRKILVIEDEKPIAEILKYRFELCCAYTGAEGVENAEEFMINALDGGLIAYPY